MVGFAIGVSRPTTLTANVSQSRKCPTLLYLYFPSTFRKLDYFCLKGLFFKIKKTVNFTKTYFSKKSGTARAFANMGKYITSQVTIVMYSATHLYSYTVIELYQLHHLKNKGNRKKFNGP